jgi:NAD(P)H-flavin reductase
MKIFFQFLDWQYSLGHVNREMFEQHLPPPDNHTLIMVCGPKGMVWKTTMPTLEEMGYSKDMIFKY